MKKTLLISGIILTTFSLMALGIYNYNNISTATFKKSKVDFVYDVDSRFMTTVTREQLQNANSIIDILPEKATRFLRDFQDVNITILGDEEKSQVGSNEILNQAQKALLKNAEYSTDFFITSNCISTENVLGALNDYDLVYYITIVPEEEAQYADGHESLMDYIQSNSIVESVELKDSHLRPGKIEFSVNENGGIENVALISTCGYESIDENLMDVINTLPKKWTPAKNVMGETVEQQYVLSFGKIGC